MAKMKLGAILLLASCAPQNDRLVIPVERDNNVQLISSPGRPEIISSTIPLPANTQNALLTFYKADSGEIKKIVSATEGEPVKISGLEDGTYKLVAEYRGNDVRPTSTQQVVVENGRFQSLELQSERITKDHFYYTWESDNEGREAEYSVNDEVVHEIEILDEDIEVHNTSAARMLYEKYNIVLSDGQAAWTYTLASNLLKSVASIPHVKLAKPAVFTLSAQHIDKDIEVQWRNGYAFVTLSLEAFTNASKKLVKLNGRRGTFFSMKLFKALVVFFTNDGGDASAVQKILNEKFGVTTNVPNYRSLTGEHPDNFQDFHPNELIKIVHAFIEMPTGYHRIPGLSYLLRRKDGHPHPTHPNAPAVAWPRGRDQDSYIEFMDTAFISGSEDYIHRLILHEKAHFLWRNVFPEELRTSWIELGQWFRNEDAASGWSTHDNTHFVSPYAHAKNPNEDMAESLSYYVLNPDKLLSVAPEKFSFIEQRIMNGYRYVSAIREDMTFEVLNLFPDYDYPGKIRRVTVEVRGNENQDKSVQITIELTNKEGIQDGAQSAYTRVFSPNETYKDLYFHPVNGDKHTLRGTLSIPKNAKRGYWNIQNITITDLARNERHEGITDFGFKMYINNRDEDITPPAYVANSIRIKATETTGAQDRQVFNIDVTWNIQEDGRMKADYPVYANMVSLDHNDRYRITGYGTFNRTTKQAHVRLGLTEFHPPGRYGVTFVSMQDQALNFGRQYFSGDPEHEPVRTVTLNPRNADYEKPVLDVNRLSVQASPVNPTAPDGGTRVNINFYAKDDKSGLGIVHYKLQDPLGRIHFNYFMHANFHTKFFIGTDPSVYKLYQIRTTLPRGSPPGRWGVREIVLQDKSGNINTYNFLETMHFQLDR